MQFDYSKLKGKMAEKGLSQKELATLIGISPATLNLKLVNRKEKYFFNQKEMSDIIRVLSIDKSSVESYFFCKKT